MADLILEGDTLLPRLSVDTTHKVNNFIKNHISDDHQVLHYTDREFLKSRGDARYRAMPYLNTYVADDVHPVPAATKVELYTPHNRTLYNYNPHDDTHTTSIMDNTTHHNIMGSVLKNVMKYAGYNHKVNIYTYDTGKGNKIKLPTLLQRHYDMAHNLFTNGLNNYQQHHEDAVHAYVGPEGFSRAINTYLLHDGKSKDNQISNEIIEDNIRRHAHNLSDHIEKNAAPLDKDYDVYSGIRNWDITKTIDEHPHKLLTSRAFLSTTLDPAGAHMRSHNPLGNRPEPDRHILHFKLPKGYNKGIYVENHNPAGPDVGEEYEYLIDRNTKWQHTGSKIFTTRPYNTYGFTNKTILHSFKPAD